MVWSQRYVLDGARCETFPATARDQISSLRRNAIKPFTTMAVSRAAPARNRAARPSRQELRYASDQ